MSRIIITKCVKQYRQTRLSYSTRLGKLSPAQYQRALERFGLGDFLRADPVRFGLFGQNVFLTSTLGEFVFRGAPHSPGQFPTERFFTNFLHQHTKTPVPYPYWFEPDPTLFGWGYALMPRMPGLNLQDPAVKAQLSLEDRLAIARVVARALVEIQAPTWQHCGSYQAETDQVVPIETDYRARVVQNIREKFEAACGYNHHTTISDRRYVQLVLAKSGAYLQLPFQPAMVHADYGEHNLLVEKINHRWQVSSVFDLMTAHFGDGAADLSGPVMTYIRENPLFADAFVQEILLHKPADEGFEELQGLYMLDRALSFWRYFQQHQGGMPEDPTKELTFEQWARPLIDYWVKA